MNITKCIDCERRIDIDIEDAHYVNELECVCDDCNDEVQNDEPKSFKTEEELVKYLRSTGDYEYNNASDQYILDEAWENGVWEEDDKGGYRLVQNDETKTYKIIRFFRDDNKPNRVILTGLTLEQAQNHCQDPDTSGDGWFDGYNEEIK
tara:strand:- start:127 stop:573 length:447 start_codon:yes stop_codon:yes gene_type:complete